MDAKDFLTYLSTLGVEANMVAQARPRLFGQFAESWRWTHRFSRVLDRSFIGDIDGMPVSETEAMVLRQIANAHSLYRTSLRRLASRDVLRSISEDKTQEIERDQMPVTASMAAILKEAHAMINSDDLSSIAFMRSNAIDLNQKDRDGLTPCAVAAQNGAEKCLFALVKNFANPHVCDMLGNTPLHWACAMGQAKIINILLYYGSNPNGASNNGVSPMMLAASKSSKESVQKLLEYGADIRMKDRRGNTVLHKSVLSKNLIMTEFLISCGALIDDHNLDGATPWGLAMKTPELAKIFVKERGNSGIHAAALF